MQPLHSIPAKKITWFHLYYSHAYIEDTPINGHWACIPNEPKNNAREYAFLTTRKPLTIRPCQRCIKATNTTPL